MFASNAVDHGPDLGGGGQTERYKIDICCLSKHASGVGAKAGWLAIGRNQVKYEYLRSVVSVS